LVARLGLIANVLTFRGVMIQSMVVWLVQKLHVIPKTL